MTMRFLAIVFLVSIFCIAPAYAAAPEMWGLNLQPAASPVKEEVHQFHNLLLIIITAITAFVFLLLVFVVFRFNKKANPTPSKTSHNTTIEIIWTVVPVLILIVIAIPSFRLLYYMDKAEEVDMTVKVIGYQWYWGYEYPDHGDISFSAYMIPDDEIDASKGQLRLLETDNRVVLPVDTNIRFLITAADVLHSWAVPALGVKRDAVPGRLNETWARITKEGVYYGQCSEICGTGHAFMPITIEAVSKERFAEWVLEQGGVMPEESESNEEAAASLPKSAVETAQNQAIVP